MSSDVVAVLRDRLRAGRPGNGPWADGHRVVLSVEGGGNRGAISGGMAGALYDAGLVPAFDAVYGSSAGTLTCAWLLSSDPHRGLQAWADPRAYARYMRAWNLLRRRPVVDLERLIGEFYDGLLGLDAEFVLANPVEFHALATDVDTGRTADLHPLVRDKAMLHAAMRASAALPILAGKPVTVDGRRYLDAGVAEAVPFRTPVADGATHVVVLRSRRLGQTPASAGIAHRLTASWLGRYSPAVRETFSDRGRRAMELDEQLAVREADPGSGPAVLVVQPGPDTPPVSRLESDGSVISAALAAGRRAAAPLLAALAAGARTS